MNDGAGIPVAPGLTGADLSKDSVPKHDDMQSHTMVSKIQQLAEKNLKKVSDELPNPTDIYKVGDASVGKADYEDMPYENKYFVFDIETYAGKLDPEYEDFKVKSKRGRLVDTAKIVIKDQETISKFALDARTGQVILAGFYDSIKKEATQIGLGKATEKLILQDTIEKFNKFINDGYKMVTYNGKLFDIPYLYKRALINGVTIKPIVQYSQLINKYNSRIHVDLFNVFEEGGKAEWAYLLGLSTTWENQAKDIAKWYMKKEFAEIRNKNLEDLKETAIIYESVKEWNL